MHNMQNRLEELMHRRVIYTVTDQDGIYAGVVERDSYGAPCILINIYEKKVEKSRKKCYKKQVKILCNFLRDFLCFLSYILYRAFA